MYLWPNGLHPLLHYYTLAGHGAAATEAWIGVIQVVSLTDLNTAAPNSQAYRNAAERALTLSVAK